MRKIHKIGIALGAVCALFAFAASSAFAVSQWLVEGNTVGAAVKAETEGSLFLAVKEGGSLLVTVECGGILDGTIGPGAEDSITELLNSSMAAIALGGTALICKVSQTNGGLVDCEAGTNAEVWAENLSWATKIVLSGTTFLDHIASNSAYEVKCKTPLGTLENLCEGEANPVLTNLASGVEGKFEAQPEAERANCSLTGAHTGEISGKGTTWAIGAELERLTTAVSDV